MAKLYKLTDENGMTRGGTQWGPGVTHSGTGKGELCGPGYIHAYEHPLIALLMNPIHAGFQNPRLWEAEGEIAQRDGQVKCGCISLTTVKEIPLPAITTAQRVRFAIMCAKTVCGDEGCNKWAAWATWATWAAWAAAESAARATEVADCDLAAIAEKAVSEP